MVMRLARCGGGGSGGGGGGVWCGKMLLGALPAMFGVPGCG